MNTRKLISAVIALAVIVALAVVLMLSYAKRH